MLHGLEPYGVKGVIWFQADGDLGRTNIYGQLIKALITEWRGDWQAELPFYYVEMNNMRDEVQTKPVQFNELSQLREAQDAALELPKTDVVCSIDVGLPEPEPHFPNKKPVGQRLALLALDHLYGFPCVCHSPTYESFKGRGRQDSRPLQGRRRPARSRWRRDERLCHPRRDRRLGVGAGQG